MVEDYKALGKGVPSVMSEAEKGAALQRLQTRCGLLESLLGEGMRLGYFDQETCSPCWLKEARKAVNEPPAEL